MTGLVSLAQATKELRYEGDAQGRKLQRHLCRREKQLKTKLLHETEGGQKRVSLGQLRALCPELRAPQERSSTRRDASGLDESVRSAVFQHYDEHAAPQVQQLLDECLRLVERVNTLERRVRDLEQRGRKNNHQEN